VITALVIKPGLVNSTNDIRTRSSLFRQP